MSYHLEVVFERFPRKRGFRLLLVLYMIAYVGVVFDVGRVGWLRVYPCLLVNLYSGRYSAGKNYDLLVLGMPCRSSSCFFFFFGF